MRGNDFDDDRVYVWTLSAEHARRFLGCAPEVPVRRHDQFEPDTRRLMASAKLYSVAARDVPSGCPEGG